MFIGYVLMNILITYCLCSFFKMLYENNRWRFEISHQIEKYNLPIPITCIVDASNFNFSYRTRLVNGTKQINSCRHSACMIEYILCNMLCDHEFVYNIWTLSGYLQLKAIILDTLRIRKYYILMLLLSVNDM